ncbi:MAG: HSP90 family protein [Oscillospiraceae bacterium]|nr:HSP90 family protein [Oscillospiraceae bacterium]MCR4759466.1 HSP90 family protein [Oscillospiraceae bacterium]
MPQNFEAPQDSFLFQVNLGGMIDILSNHLYSSPDVFVRELLQNAVDAIAAKRKKFPEDTSENAVTLTLSSENGRPLLCFADTGTGLTESEIHRFLAVIGQSSKHDLTSGKVQEDYIGRFGIGLLSCFLVSDTIRVQTRSVLTPEQSLEWCGNPDGTYTITPCEPLPQPGTRILLSPKADCEKYFTAERLTELVQYYGLPLPEPIRLIENGNCTLLNPPFPSGETQYAQIMALGESLFHTGFLGYIPLNSPSGLFSGVAYILSSETAPTAKHSHRIYLKNMLLTEDGGRLLPKWAFFLRCFLNTSGLQPTASREDFYENDALLRAREELSDCITGYLRRLASEDDAMLQRIVRIHRLAVQSVAVEDDALYRAFFPYLTFETSFGTLTGSNLLQMDQKIYYTPFIDEYRQVAAISRARDTLLVNAGYTYVGQLLDRMPLLKHDVAVLQMRPERLDEMLEKPELSDPAAALRLLAECNELLAPYDCAAALKRFAPEDMPVLYTVNEEALLLRDIRHSIEKTTEIFRGMLDAFAEEYQEEAVAKLYLNTDNPLICRLMQITDSEKLHCCIEILYVQALLTGGYPMRNHEMQILNGDLLRLLNWSVES